MIHDNLTHLANIELLRHDTLLGYTEDELAAFTPEHAAMLVTMLPKSRPVQAAPVAYAVPMVKPRTVRTCKTHKAALWFKDRMVTLAWFSDEQVRAEAVAMAKSMRSLGLPLEAIREAMQRMIR